ncbi:VOC family protein [Sphingorhabdus sp. Alg231-15]|uniref:VOC family protein n=1 Tax=Sphingorhabdus sp. Alg231-15 TaxID=1922222 RepID=UPI000D55D55D
MRKYRQLIISLVAAFLVSASPVQAETSGTARFDRASLIVKDMEQSLLFWRDVMQFDLLFEPRQLPPLENEYLGWTKNAVLTFARLQSPDGAGIGLMEIKQPGFPDLELEKYPNAHGSVIFVHVAKDIEALHNRALAAGTVLKPLGLSRSGRSRQMYLRSPSGHVLEIYELLPTEEKPN